MAIVSAELAHPCSSVKALPTAATAIRIDHVVSVASRACRLSRIGGCDRVAPQHVRPHRHDFEMCGVHAQPHSAQVVNGHALRDWPEEVLVSPAMRGIGFLGFRRSESAVASIIGASGPEPTTVGLFLDAEQESLLIGEPAPILHYERVAVRLEAAQMLDAETSLTRKSRTAVDAAFIPSSHDDDITNSCNQGGAFQRA